MLCEAAHINLCTARSMERFSRVNGGGDGRDLRLLAVHKLV